MFLPTYKGSLKEWNFFLIEVKIFEFCGLKIICFLIVKSFHDRIFIESCWNIYTWFSGDVVCKWLNKWYTGHEQRYTSAKMFWKKQFRFFLYLTDRWSRVELICVFACRLNDNNQFNDCGVWFCVCLCIVTLSCENVFRIEWKTPLNLYKVQLHWFSPFAWKKISCSGNISFDWFAWRPHIYIHIHRSFVCWIFL